MSTALDTPELMDSGETYDLHKPQRHSAPRSFWSTLIQSMRRAYVQRFEPTPRAYGHVSLPIEGPADRLARQSPKLYLQAFAGAS